MGIKCRVHVSDATVPYSTMLGYPLEIRDVVTVLGGKSVGLSCCLFVIGLTSFMPRHVQVFSLYTTVAVVKERSTVS